MQHINFKISLNFQNLDLSYHIGVQTDHDPESSVSYSDSYKSEIYAEDPTFFHAVDAHVIEEVTGVQKYFYNCDDKYFLQVSERWYKSVKKLVRHIQQAVDTAPAYKERPDLVTVRGIFVWVAENIRCRYFINNNENMTLFVSLLSYDPFLADTPLDTVDILHDKVGSRKDFVKIFGDLCQAADIKHKVITGFIKDDNYKPGEHET